MPGTRVRYRVLWLGFLISLITYLDRVAISAAAPLMMSDLSLSDYQMSYAFSAFALAYGIFEIPAGWWGDRIGQRRMLTRIVACWSVFTSLTGAVRGVFSLVLVRFVFGAAEAGAFPTLSRGLARWFPRGARGMVNGVMWSGARLGGAIAPAIAVASIGYLGWRWTFVLFGAIGLVWCVIFWRWYTDDPAEHPGVDAGELTLIRDGVRPRPACAAHPPWRKIVTNSNFWSLFWAYFAASFGFYFFVTWLPTYLIREHGLTLHRSGWYSALPLGAAAVACVSGGSLSDWLVRRTGSLRWGRAIVGVTGFVLGAAGFAAAALSRGPLEAVLWLAAAQAALDTTTGVSWATCVEIGGSWGGTLSGFMNMASSIAAVILPLAATWLEHRFGTFHALFALAAVVYFTGGLLWLRINPALRLED